MRRRASNASDTIAGAIEEANYHNSAQAIALPVHKFGS
jgi:hypothetical protein